MEPGRAWGSATKRDPIYDTEVFGVDMWIEQEMFDGQKKLDENCK